jgi:hypothetical protein
VLVNYETSEKKFVVSRAEPSSSPCWAWRKGGVRRRGSTYFKKKENTKDVK